jgi:hypothetical protein
MYRLGVSLNEYPSARQMLFVAAQLTLYSVRPRRRARGHQPAASSVFLLDHALMVPPCFAHKHHKPIALPQPCPQFLPERPPSRPHRIGVATLRCQGVSVRTGRVVLKSTPPHRATRPPERGTAYPASFNRRCTSTPSACAACHSVSTVGLRWPSSSPLT